jgi:hypothetical protein
MEEEKGKGKERNGNRNGTDRCKKKGEKNINVRKG